MMRITARLLEALTDGKVTWTGGVQTEWYLSVAEVTVKTEDGKTKTYKVSIDWKGRVSICTDTDRSDLR